MSLNPIIILIFLFRTIKTITMNKYPLVKINKHDNNNVILKKNKLKCISNQPFKFRFRNTIIFIKIYRVENRCLFKKKKKTTIIWFDQKQSSRGIQSFSIGKHSV